MADPLRGPRAGPMGVRRAPGARTPPSKGPRAQETRATHLEGEALRLGPRRALGPPTMGLRGHPGAVRGRVVELGGGCVPLALRPPLARTWRPRARRTAAAAAKQGREGAGAQGAQRRVDSAGGPPPSGTATGRRRAPSLAQSLGPPGPTQGPVRPRTLNERRFLFVWRLLRWCFTATPHWAPCTPKPHDAGHAAGCSRCLGSLGLAGGGGGRGWPAAGRRHRVRRACRWLPLPQRPPSGVRHRRGCPPHAQPGVRCRPWRAGRQRHRSLGAGAAVAASRRPPGRPRPPRMQPGSQHQRRLPALAAQRQWRWRLGPRGGAPAARVLGAARARGLLGPQVALPQARDAQDAAHQVRQGGAHLHADGVRLPLSRAREPRGLLEEGRAGP